jgi:hypothetical protein
MVLGAMAAVFALMLLALPLWRFAQGRLSFRDSVGFWIAGAGFAVLATAAFTGEAAVAQQMVVVGVVLAAAGSVVRNVVGEG